MEKRILETLCIRITTRCNLHCNFCRAGSSPYCKTNIDLESLRNFLLDAKSNLGLKHVSISGGEPGVDKRLIPFIDWLISKKIFVTVTTNGNSKLSSRLIKLKTDYSNFLRIRVSIDGNKDLHDQLRGAGTYKSAIRETKLLKEYLGWVGVNTIIGKKFLSEKSKLVEVLKSIPVDEWALITPVPKGSAKGQSWFEDEFMPHILSFRKKAYSENFEGRIVIWNFLGTPNTSVLVRADGTVILTGVNGDDDIAMGSISSYSLPKIVREIKEITTKKDETYFNWKGRR